MRRLIINIATILFGLSFCAYGQWNESKIVHSDDGGEAGYVSIFSGTPNSRTIEDSGVTMTYLSNGVAIAVWASNAVVVIQGSTDLWNQASLDAIYASNTVVALSNSWYNSIAYQISSMDTQRWNTGYDTAVWSSNNFANYVPKSGGTFTGAVYTTLDYVADSPASKELVSAEWVRSLTVSGAEWFFTTNVMSGYGEKTPNFVELQTESPANLFTNTTSAPISDDTYLAGGVSTQLYSSLRSPISFNIYMALSGNGSVQVHPEVYYIYEGSTNQLGDWEVGYQEVSGTDPMLYTFVVPFIEPTITGGVYVVAYLKSDTVTPPNVSDLHIYGGGIYASHMDIEGINEGETAAEVQANLDVHTGLEGTNVHGLGTMSLADTGTYYLASNPDGYITDYVETDPIWSTISNAVVTNIIITEGTTNSWSQTNQIGYLTIRTNYSGGGGDVTKVGTPINNQVGVWTGDGTLEGDAGLAYASGGDLTLTRSVAGSHSVRLTNTGNSDYGLATSSDTSFSFYDYLNAEYIWAYYQGKTRIGGNSIFGTATLDVRTTNTTDVLNLYSNATELLTVTSAGDVGINTSTPTAKLHVVDTIAAQILVSGWDSYLGAGETSSTCGEFLLGATAANQGRIHYNGNIAGHLFIENSWNSDNADIRFRTKTAGTAVEAMTISGDGNVGIDTTSPEQPLHVVGANTNLIYVEESTGDTGDIAGMAFRTSGSAARGFFKGAIIYEDDGTSFARGKLHLCNDNVADSRDADASDAALTVAQDGSVGINDTTPTYTLDVNGTIRCTGKLTATGGVDPPYSHHWEQSLANVTNRVAYEVPPSKYKGVVNAYIEDMDAMFWWQPSSGKYLKLDMDGGVIIKGKINAWTNNQAPFAWTTNYFLDSTTGDIVEDLIPETPPKWVIKKGYRLDAKSGKLLFNDDNSTATKAEALEFIVTPMNASTNDMVDE